MNGSGKQELHKRKKANGSDKQEQLKRKKANGTVQQRPLWSHLRLSVE